MSSGDCFIGTLWISLNFNAQTGLKWANTDGGIGRGQDTVDDETALL